MAYSINKHIKGQGITLVEILVYMAIFSILVTGFLSSSFYIQKVIQARTYGYKTKQCMYDQLYILQQYARFVTRYTIENNVIILHTKYNQLTFSLNHDGNTEFTFDYPVANNKKIIQQCDNIRFTNLHFSFPVNPTTLTEKEVLEVSLEFFDNRKIKNQTIEHLVI